MIPDIFDLMAKDIYDYIDLQYDEDQTYENIDLGRAKIMVGLIAAYEKGMADKSREK